MARTFNNGMAKYNSEKLARTTADSEHDYTETLAKANPSSVTQGSSTPSYSGTTTRSSSNIKTYSPNNTKEDSTSSAYKSANRVNADSEHDATEELASLANQINTPKETTPTTINSKTTTIKNKAYLPGSVNLEDSSSSELTDLYEAGVGDASSYRKNSEGDVIGYGDYGEDVVPTTTTTGGGVVTEDVVKQFEEDYGVKYDPNLSYKDNLYMAGITQTQNQELYANKKSARLAYENTIAKIDEEELKARQQAEDANRLAYIRRMFANKDLNQQLALQGITGGATESALLQLASNYGNQVATNNQNLANALSGYSTDRLNAYNQKEQAIADAKAQREQNIANALSTLQTQQYTTETEKKASTTPTATATNEQFYNDPSIKDKYDVYQWYKTQGYDDTYSKGKMEEYQKFVEETNAKNSLKTKVSADEDDGTLYWNGKTYAGTKAGAESLIKDINKENLTQSELNILKTELAKYGIVVSF